MQGGAVAWAHSLQPLDSLPERDQANLTPDVPLHPILPFSSHHASKCLTQAQAGRQAEQPSGSQPAQSASNQHANPLVQKARNPAQRAEAQAQAQELKEAALKEGPSVGMPLPEAHEAVLQVSASNLL